VWKLAALLLAVLSLWLIVGESQGVIGCQTIHNPRSLGFWISYDVHPNVCAVESIAPLWAIGMLGLLVAVAQPLSRSMR